ncbi:hypothetical protein [Bradyrhizobium sp.]|uniref:hypothetical protein n=1 Tax=Bradyrhizobium sp. TaxID=376 RepID=UPI003BAF1468
MFPHDRDLSLTTHLDGEIRDGRHHMQVRVYYEDTDFSHSQRRVMFSELPSTTAFGPKSEVKGCILL